jgi:hypothetical protein
MEHLNANISVRHFGMKLKTYQTTLQISHGSKRGISGVRQRDKPRRELFHPITMAHPYLIRLSLSQATEDLIRFVYL